MDFQDFIALDALSGKTPKDIETEHPDLYARLQDQLKKRLRRTVDRHFEDQPDIIREAVRDLDFEDPVRAVPRRDIEARLRMADLPDRDRARALNRLSRLELPAQPRALLHRGTAIAANPLFARELATARSFRLAKEADIDATVAERLVESGMQLFSLKDDDVKALIERQILDQEAAARLGKRLSLYRLLEEDFALIEVVQEQVRLPDDAGAADTLRPLAGLDAGDWGRALEKADTSPPPGLDRADHARLIERKLAALFPTVTLLRKVGSGDAPDPDLIARLKPLAVAGISTAARPGSFDLSGRDDIDDDTRAAAEDGHAAVFKMIAAHPGLKLAQVLDDIDTADDERAEIVARRLEADRTFREANANVDFLSFDLTAANDRLTDQLKLDRIDDEMRPLVLANARAYQRAYMVADEDALDAAELIVNGFAGANAIAALTEDAFVAAVPFDRETAQVYHAKALSIAADVGVAAVGIRDAVAGGLGWLDSGNIGPDIGDFFRQLDGWEELFGAQTFCDCPECGSVLGAAAYYADLMTFVEDHVLDVVFTGANADAVLALRNRRPDLWSLQLSCANTNTEIPLLVIVNEVMETYLAKRQGFGGGNRKALVEFVYRDHLATTVESFDQPMVLPHRTLTAYLAHFRLTQDVVLPFVDIAPEQAQAIRLGLPRVARDLIATPNIQRASLRRIYGFDFAGTGQTVSTFDSAVLSTATGLEAGDLEALVRCGFVTDRGAENPRLRGGKRDDRSVQFDIERAAGFNLGVLDRMHRIFRLSRATGLSYPALDVIDVAVRQAGRGGDLTEALGDVAALLDLMARHGADVAEAASLLGRVSNEPGDRGASLLKRRFNANHHLERGVAWPSAGESFVHPVHALVPDAATDATLGRLRGGLGLKADVLADLIALLAVPLGADLQGDTDTARRFALSADNLGLLFRHATLLDWLGITVAELGHLIELAPGIAGPALTDFDEVIAFLNFADRIGTAPLSIEGAHRAAGLADLEVEATALAKTLRDRIVTGQGSRFAGAVFAGTDGLTALQSQDIIDANAGIFEPAGADGFYRLIAGADLAPALALPAGVVADDGALKEALTPHAIPDLLAEAVAGQFATTREAAQTLIAASGIDATAAATADALRGDGGIDPLLPAMTALLRITAAMSPARTAPEVLAYATSHMPLFGAPDAGAIDAMAALRLAGFAAMAPAAAMALVPVLEGYDGAGFDPTTGPALGSFLGLSAGAAMALSDAVALPVNALDALGLLELAAGLTGTLGVTADFLGNAAANDYDRLDAAANAVIAALRVQHPDDHAWAEVNKDLEAKILNARRDGLAAYLIHSIHPEFENFSQLYDYFLLPTEVDGCFPTSRVVAGTTSLQAYVNRIQMNREQSADGSIRVDPGLIPAEEWDWRRNFQVWKANRKVFLWTENYLDPGFRDNKTPLFETFEAEVLQNELDEQAILDAYARYLEGFEVLANLRIAGSFHAIDDANETDVLHLIGVTPGDPPTFYYRTAENIKFGHRSRTRNTRWNPWKPINIKIPVREVSPVVHDGRLHVFWVEIVTTAQNEVREAGSRFIGYKHRFAIKFSTLRLDGEWTVPQAISLYGTPPFGETDGVIDDPLVDPEEAEAFFDAIRDMFGFGIFSSDPADLDGAIKAMLTPRYDTEPHTTAREGYSLVTPEWSRVHPESTPSGIRLSGIGCQMRAMVDLFDKDTRAAPDTKRQGRIRWTKNSSPPSPILSERDDQLWFGQLASAPFDDYAFVALAADSDARQRVQRHAPEDFRNLSSDGLFQGKLANLRGADVQPINGSLIDAVIDRDGDLLLFQGTALPGQTWVLKRIGTTLARTIARRLFTGGIDGLLEMTQQESLRERSTPIGVTSSSVIDAIVDDGIDFNGAFGTYYREILFHVPFLLARTLQEQGSHAEAKRWYEYIFDPTTTETIADIPALSDEQNAARQRDRNWRYVEFRGLSVPRLRTILTQQDAIAAYRDDPFNPHAIARLRISAYQKATVMSYVRNEIDWGDRLFRQFQQETIAEAIIHYQTAREILGPRPRKIGDCGQIGGRRSYDAIKPALESGSTFLAELENWLLVDKQAGRPAFVAQADRGLTLDVEVASSATWKAAMSQEMKAKGLVVVGESHLDGRRATVHLDGTPNQKLKARTSFAADTAARAQVDEPMINPSIAAAAAAPAEPDEMLVAELRDTRARFVPGTSVAAFAELRERVRDAAPDADSGDWRGVTRKKRGRRRGPRFVLSVLRTISPVFCVPGNEELLGYWNLVDDRLYKIHNCLDIDGNRRQLTLFAPEIDPRALIRARAAGLSTDDIFAALNGSAPPLRFGALIDKAKQFAGTVQSFGSALQAALEKKDGEALNLLRLTQGRDVLGRTTQTRTWERDIALRNHEAMLARQVTLNNALSRTEGLIDDGLNTEEATQRIAHHTASALRGVEAVLGFLAGAVHLIPEAGSPFAMKYGGKQAGDSAQSFMVGTRALADLAGAVASSAALEATFTRRTQGWNHHAGQQRDQLKELEKELAASELRTRIAERAVTLHELSITHAEELQSQAENKFSNLAFHDWAAATLQTVHRDAFNCAMSLARMAEAAYRFERSDQTSELLSGNYWDSGRSGLHAGARLTVDLQNLEKRFLETTPSHQEIDQTFSLFQIDPAALVELKTTGTTRFSLPESFCDIYYPGMFLRLIKAVRVTVPTVAGPHANISAMLTLEDSFLRRDPDPGAALQAVPAARGQTISTSTAQSDAGVFELNFGGAKYLPFEGAGVISQWRLTLPRADGFPPFDYSAISDVLLRISYTAEFDGILREHTETQNAALAGTLAQTFQDNGLQRVISLRQEHRDVFQALVAGPPDTAVDLTVGPRHFPIFVAGRALTISNFRLAVQTGGGVGTLAFTVDGDATTAFGAAVDLGNMAAAAVAPMAGNDPRGTWPVTVSDAGDLGGADGSALDTDAVRDIYVIIDYGIGARQ
ncbi:neuraminidase-like domain-containing protein [Jannaschia rubra]|uniref:Tc toxin subunit A-related protein n=1 Tax=Jannaschia rubra TaxID=282197 RepID=UPI00249119B2|nr:neuraminidase-like domain-containing protein [Jannaschia rubra]